MTKLFRALAVLTIIAMTAATGAAQQQPVRDNLSAPTGTGLIAGVAEIDDSSSRPLRRAVVRLSGGDMRVMPVTLTDSEGRFSFTSLPAGRYIVNVSKAGYVPTTYGAKKPGSTLGLPIALTEGQKVTSLRVRVLHGGVITGAVRDEMGRPQPNTQVIVSGARLVNGRMVADSFISSGFVLTDDRGVYRAYGLAPGSYTVSVSAGSSGAGAQRLTTDDEVRWAVRRAQAAAQGIASAAADPGNPAPPQGRPVSYTSIYYPDVIDPQSASVVTIGPGEERGGIDIGLRLVPTAKVEGTVLGLDGKPAPNAQAQLVSGSSGQNDLTALLMMDFMMMNMPRTPAPGKFSFPAVRPGEYTIVVRAASKPAAAAGALSGGRGAAPAAPVLDLWAQTPIAVDGNDMTGISLTLQPGMTIAGRVLFEGAIPPPDLTRVSVMLQLPPSSGPRVGAPQATVHDDGTFAIEGVTPGAYRIDAYAPGMTNGTQTWTLRSASLKGQNLTDLPFEVRPNENLSGVTVRFTDKTTEITGSLIDSAGRPAPEYFVMAYPADRKQWYPGARAIRQPTRPDSAGKFTITGLPPGDYYICALPDFEQNTLNDASFLEQLVPGSIKLSLAEGEKKKQDLKLAGG